MLIVRNLQVGTRLAGLSFSVAPGEVVALVGSQGSGKSTLLRALVGLEPFTGSATVAGAPAGSAQGRLRVGLAGEQYGVPGYFTVREHLRLYAGLFGLPEARGLDLARAGELTALVNTRAQKLRPGELARLRLVRALLHDPAVLLLDEPIGDVDRESQAIISFLIGEAADQGKAVLLATFGHPKVMELAGRHLYLEDGRLLEPAVAGAAGGEDPRRTSEAAPRTPEVALSGHVGPTPAGGRGAEPIRHIAARKDERVMLYAPGEIRYAYAQEKMVYIQTADGACTVTFTLAELEDRLTRDGFIRCHRGYVVNVAWVKEIASWTRDSHSLILKDGTEVPLSKHRLQALRSQLGL